MSEFFNLSQLVEIILVGLILSADSFSAAVAMGNRPFTSRDAYLFAFSSGTAEALVAWIGAVAGSQVIAHFASIDHWIAFGLLALVAAHMAYEGVRDLISSEFNGESLVFHGFVKILIVSFATSLDAFGVGIGLGIAGKPLAAYILSIGFWASVTTVLGLYLAKKLSRKFGPVMSIVGSIILGALAYKMLEI